MVTSSTVLAPNLVSTDRTAFYSATWVNQGPPTLANPEVVITVPAGSAVVSADPPVCTVSVPSGGPGPSSPARGTTWRRAPPSPSSCSSGWPG